MRNYPPSSHLLQFGTWCNYSDESISREMKEAVGGQEKSRAGVKLSHFHIHIIEFFLYFLAERKKNYVFSSSGLTEVKNDHVMRGDRCQSESFHDSKLSTSFAWHCQMGPSVKRINVRVRSAQGRLLIIMIEIGRGTQQRRMAQSKQIVNQWSLFHSLWSHSFIPFVQHSVNDDHLWWKEHKQRTMWAPTNDLNF